VYFGAVSTNYGLSFFLPANRQDVRLNSFLTTLASAAPTLSVSSAWCGGRRSERLSSTISMLHIPLFIAAPESHLHCARQPDTEDALALAWPASHFR